jgi:hypothetical protein
MSKILGLATTEANVENSEAAWHLWATRTIRYLPLGN